MSGHTPSVKVIKSGVLYKKIECVLRNPYKERLLELTNHGELMCYHVQSDGQKVKKESIQLTPTTRIEKRSGRAHARRNAKFIIHMDNGTRWYLWCKKEDTTPQQREKAPTATIYKQSPKSRTNPVASSVSYNHVLFPYHQYHRRHTSPSIPAISSVSNLISLNSSPPREAVHKSSYTSLTSIACDVRRASSKSCGSLLSPIQLSVDIVEMDVEFESGEREALEWCDTLKHCIAHMRPRANKFSLSNTSSECDECDACDADEVISMPWTLKSCYMMLKLYRYGYKRNIYKRMYFVLRMNGILDYFVDETQKEQKGCIDILGGGRRVERRNGNNDCKFVVFTQSDNAYYFWCKDDKNLCTDWYYLMQRIISDKMKNIDQYLKVAESTDSDWELY